ncbi:MAG: helicase [Hyphomicrobiaceae bacterium]|nr:helicase [Hyphomicrobiaceae bacterium]
MSDELYPNGERGRGVTAVLGPTNTGKTHLAIERMLGHETGIIGLPLRLLAREVYDKVVARIGAGSAALITGEEKIVPQSPRYYICTVEAMPRDLDVEFLAVDEVQLAADPERGHVFTRHLLRARGTAETLMLGAATMKDAITGLLPGVNIISRPRLSELSYAGQKKISRVPRRAAVVTFAVNELYAIAELVRRQRGGAAVVLGALSPKTRNAQVELYQSGEVDFLVATDAIGMGLNLDIDHVAFASLHKFDGREHRELTNAEIGQVAGRAGRHTNSGTFGVTSKVEPFDQIRVSALESHAFEPVKKLQWRNDELDFSTLAHLTESLRAEPDHARLIRGRMVDDLIALENLSKDETVRSKAIAPAAIKRLWEVCQIPDYRKISVVDHAELLTRIYGHLMSDTGLISEDWMSEQIGHADNTSGDIDALANRISHIRTWTFVSHRSDWLADPQHWQERTRAIEDKLSDALHERLTQRFVDRRTSVLMKRLRDQDVLNAEIEADGSVHVERHFVGKLNGFRFTPDTTSGDVHGKAARHAAAKVLAEELSERAARLSSAEPDALELTRTGEITWEGAAVARLEAGDSKLNPSISLLADEHLSATDRTRIEAKLSQWLSALISERLEPLVQLNKAEDVSGLARGVAFRLVESFGVLKREEVADDIRMLDQDARGQLRRYGVRFGAFNIFLPALLKPAASDLALLLWGLSDGAAHNIEVASLPEPPREGLTSAASDPKLPEAFYRTAGFHRCGRRVVRIDMLERLADMIRPLISWREQTKSQAKAPETVEAQSAETPQQPAKAKEKSETSAAAPAPEKVKPAVAPAGATGDGGFRVTPNMMSIVGCSGEEFAEVLKELGFRLERKPVKPAKGTPDTSEAQAVGPGENTVETQTTEQDARTLDEIWRPRKKRHPNVPRGAKRSLAPGRKGPQKHKNRPGSFKARKPAAKPKPRREVDPDSPFAALKDLKRDLQARAKDRV